MRGKVRLATLLRDTFLGTLDDRFVVRRNLGGVAFSYLATNSAAGTTGPSLEAMDLLEKRLSRWNLNGLTTVAPGGVGGLVLEVCECEDV